MLTVIKRSGKEEAFSIEKIKNSVAAASDELRRPLSSSDLQNLAGDIQKKLVGKEKITSRELYETVIFTMREQGFSELTDAYVGSKSNSWA